MEIIDLEPEEHVTLELNYIYHIYPFCSLYFIQYCFDILYNIKIHHLYMSYIFVGFNH